MPWKEQIEKKCQTVGKLFADKNWTELAKCYTEDASLMPPHGVRYAGRDSKTAISIIHLNLATLFFRLFRYHRIFQENLGNWNI